MHDTLPPDLSQSFRRPGRPSHPHALASSPARRPLAARERESNDDLRTVRGRQTGEESVGACRVERLGHSLDQAPSSSHRAMAFPTPGRAISSLDGYTSRRARPYVPAIAESAWAAASVERWNRAGEHLDHDRRRCIMIRCSDVKIVHDRSDDRWACHSSTAYNRPPM